MSAKRKVVIHRTRSTLEELGASTTDLLDYQMTGERVPASGFATWLPPLQDLALIVEQTFAPDDEGRAGLVCNDADLLDLARSVQASLATDGIDAVVVTHGTNGLEETSLFLWASLTVPLGKRVVVTGAMRPASAISSDGPRNLWAAVRVAIDPSRLDVGVCTVLDDEIMAADAIEKRHTTALDAFHGRSVGVLGTVGPDEKVRWIPTAALAAPSWLTQGILTTSGLADVPAVVSWTGDGAARVLRDLLRRPPVGVTFVGRGNGHPTPEETKLLRSLTASGVLVCIASRVGDGWVHVPAVGRDDGWIGAGPRRWWAARLLLSAACTQTAAPTALQQLLWGVYDHSDPRTGD